MEMDLNAARCTVDVVEPGISSLSSTPDRRKTHFENRGLNEIQLKGVETRVSFDFSETNRSLVINACTP